MIKQEKNTKSITLLGAALLKCSALETSEVTDMLRTKIEILIPSLFTDQK